MWDNLPTEISTDILHRLPVKTLIKCTTLSKSFLSLITSRDFISDHIPQHTNSHLLLRYFTQNNQEKYHFEPDNDTFSGFQNQGLLVPFLNYPNEWFTVAGCVNGVLCLVNDYRTEGTLIILWNPSIRKFVHVPRPIFVFEKYGGYESACGFGFDSISDDYKVVRVVDLGPEFQATQIEVYSLKSGCWRVIGVGPCYSIKLVYCGGYTSCFLNGSVHWVGSRFVSPNDENVILKFDMSTECFEIIQLPRILQETKAKFSRILDLFIHECNGMLTLIKWNYNDAIQTCSIWLMKEYGVVKSWTKTFDLDIGNLRPREMPKAFGFRKYGEVIMVNFGGAIFTLEKNLVVSIDRVTHSETTLREIIADHSYYLSTYVESMVLFKEGIGIEDQTTQLDLLLRNQDDLMGK
ncbi:F-box protein CPR1-like [Silene latifolia]|uniref:F-box protein CPR1-like n=1 Tax=Silene latifolia TaxID=37657 RepID=UPI003D789B5A